MVIRLYRRVIQFIRAITASINFTDERFLADYLTAAEQKLFRQMSIPDQRHSFNVAYTAQQLAERSTGIRLRLLTRAALLHDVGRTNLSTADKVLAVLFSAAFPFRAQQWAGNKDLRHPHGIAARFHQRLFVYYQHGAMGARRLQQLGSDREIVKMVARHHQKAADDDPAELALLRQADQMN